MSQKRLLVVAIVLLAALLLPGEAGAAPVCHTTNYSSYSVELCIDNPADGAVVSGLVTVDASISLSGSPPNIAKLLFYLNNEYLLTDFRTPYTFTIPTEKFVDGAYELSVEANMGDGRTTQRAAIDLTFNNGITEPPVNTNTFTPYTGSTPPPGQPFIVAATGDGASGEWPQVTDMIAAWNPDMFLYLGDVYNKGTATEFYNWYGTATEYFGQFRDITNPTIGNHEYENGVAPGYFDYWTIAILQLRRRWMAFVTIDSPAMASSKRAHPSMIGWFRSGQQHQRLHDRLPHHPYSISARACLLRLRHSGRSSSE